MRTVVLRLAGLILVLGFLAAPRSALAAPSITISPGSGAVGDYFTVTGIGFDPNVAYTFRIQSQDRQATLGNSATFVQVAADGTFTNRFNIVSDRPAGTYIGEVLTAGNNPTVVAGATFVLTGPAGAPTATAVAPTAVPPTTVPPTTVAPTAVAPTATAVVPTAVAPTTVPPTVAPTQAPRPAPTATMPAMPGLPNTGSGGMSGGDVGLRIGLGLVVSAALVVGVARRRAA